MNHSDFDWDFENITHLARHGVTPEEAEDVLTGQPMELGEEYIDGEQRFSHIGFTRTGRVLLVVETIRRQHTRVITSFQPSAKLRREFLLSRSYF
jgi:uncharacterized DUF497 family protein